MISEGDIRFIKDTLMPWARVKKLRLVYDNSKRKYPDIQIELGDIPTMTITDEWKKQNIHERRKRLTHEFCHLLGMEHDEALGYSTYPDKDTYSMRVYRKLLEVRNLYQKGDEK